MVLIKSNETENIIIKEDFDQDYLKNLMDVLTDEYEKNKYFLVDEWSSDKSISRTFANPTTGYYCDLILCECMINTN